MIQSEGQRIVFFDTEVTDGGHVQDAGAIDNSGRSLHCASVTHLVDFIGEGAIVAGHNIVCHDLKFLPGIKATAFIDTLYASALLFPRKPHHHLLKDEKIVNEEFNNPLSDAKKAQELFADEVNALLNLKPDLRDIYSILLADTKAFGGLFAYLGLTPPPRETLKDLIDRTFAGKICAHADVERVASLYPIETAFALSLIDAYGAPAAMPTWALRNHPHTGNVMQLLRSTPCKEGCEYCNVHNDVSLGLKRYFNFDQFRTYGGEPLQQQAAEAALRGESILVIFPTGGGKSLTFQLPALMQGDNAHGLTVVISPLQSLMKDQVDNLTDRGITKAVSINGLQDAISRAEACNMVADGTATMLYVAPEMLRSRTLQRLLMGRHVVRFVIDEAHCFSSWGQDFRVDYLHIADYVRQLSEQKCLSRPIPISCFTATAKQKVVSDICDYFRKGLGVELHVMASRTTRTNLHYTVLHVEDDNEKYTTLRNLLAGAQTPAIVYASRTHRVATLAENLTRDGLPALAYHGRMESNEKIANQNSFEANEVKIMVATSAFGMGVDKKDVGMVIHYDISDSLENYVQEAGRAGRDPSTEARCYVLFNESDLDKHFIFLNQSKLSISEIQQVWQAIKSLTAQRTTVSCSALEIARQAGWDDSVQEIETRVRSAIAALENAGYVKRGNNMPQVFATSIMVRNMTEARERLMQSALFAEEDRQNAIRIIKSLISQKSRVQEEEIPESRIDYLADILGLSKETVVNTVNRLRQEGLLADFMDMTAVLIKGDSQKSAIGTLARFGRLERTLIEIVGNGMEDVSLKDLNQLTGSDAAWASKGLRTILNFLTIKRHLDVRHRSGRIDIKAVTPQDHLLRRHDERMDLCRFIIEDLFAQATEETSSDTLQVSFSVVGLLNKYNSRNALTFNEPASLPDVEEALLYLSRIGALKLEGGFLVLYNAMQIRRTAERRLRYVKDDYRLLDDFYRQKIQQIHIVGEFANLMVRDATAALAFVREYFEMDYKQFIAKHFNAERRKEISHNITKRKYDEIFGGLSARQHEIISDNTSGHIVVAAGPGSGKTRVLVHKLASLLLMEDVKHEQLLMLTFSRAAATEFKSRLMGLIGNAAHFVEIKTFHSYSFDILGRNGSLAEADNVVRMAVDAISRGDVEQGRLAKTVLVIDEAQDMDADEFALVNALMTTNDNMRVIAVGDDDQNIYEFRGADSRHFASLISQHDAKKYELIENYRSARPIVTFANMFAHGIAQRMKSTDISAIRTDSGAVHITHHHSAFLEEPIVADVMRHPRRGSVCILTVTNDEAVRLCAMLTREGIDAEIISSAEGVRLQDMVEVRFFLKMLDANRVSAKISPEHWEWAKSRTMEQYARSKHIGLIATMIRAFEQVNRHRYRGDVEEFIRESDLTDFKGQATVSISTIHKAKGREFDTVFMMLSNVNLMTDSDIRKVYVGLTRAKLELFIHKNNPSFPSVASEGITTCFDPTPYARPSELAFQLTHRDVHLNFFKDKKREILSLNCGASLIFSDMAFSIMMNGLPITIARLSHSFEEKLSRLYAEGYTVTQSEVGYILAWRPQDESLEYAIILPSIRLRRQCKKKDGE